MNKASMATYHVTAENRVLADEARSLVICVSGQEREHRILTFGSQVEIAQAVYQLCMALIGHDVLCETELRKVVELAIENAEPHEHE